jgi:hypothetical protein
MFAWLALRLPMFGYGNNVPPKNTEDQERRKKMFSTG